MAGKAIFAVVLVVGALLPTSSSAQKKSGCAVQHEAPSAADAALARDDYAAALDLYKKMASEDADASRAGVIRTLLGQDKLKDAEDLAQAWVKSEPKNAGATETLGEVFLREGELGDVHTMVQATLQLDPCSARNYLLGAQVESLMANFKTAKEHIELAHRLHPDDVDIRSAWIDTLPRDQRLQQEKLLLKEDNLLSSNAKKSLEKEVAQAALPRDECRLATPVTKTKMKITSGNYALALAVKFNGDTRLMQIDTGASGITISKLAAQGLGLVREDTTRVGGMGDSGDVKSSVAHVANLKIGELEFQNCRVDIIENYQTLDSVGLIGLDVFRNFLITLDIGREALHLDPLPERPQVKTPAAESLATDASTQNENMEWHDRYIAPEMADWTKVLRVGHNILVPVQLNDTLQRLFLMDTGSGPIVISTEAAKAVTKIRYDPADSLTGLSGQVKKVYATGKFKLGFGDLFQPIESIMAVDTSKISHDVGIEVSGFLGMPMLRPLILHIDYRDNLVKFEKGPIKW